MSGGELKLQGNFEFPPWGDSTLQTSFTFKPRKIEVKVLRQIVQDDTSNETISEKLSEYLNDGWTIIHQSTCSHSGNYNTFNLVTVLHRYSDWNAGFHCPYDTQVFGQPRTEFKNHEAK